MILLTDFQREKKHLWWSPSPAQCAPRVLQIKVLWINMEQFTACHWVAQNVKSSLQIKTIWRNTRKFTFLMNMPVLSATKSLARKTIWRSMKSGTKGCAKMVCSTKMASGCPKTYWTHFLLRCLQLPIQPKRLDWTNDKLLSNVRPFSAVNNISKFSYPWKWCMNSILL